MIIHRPEKRLTIVARKTITAAPQKTEKTEPVKEPTKKKETKAKTKESEEDEDKKKKEEEDEEGVRK